MAVVSVCVHRGTGSADERPDVVAVDTSALRLTAEADAPLRAWLADLAAARGATLVDDDAARQAEADAEAAARRAERRARLPTPEDFAAAEAAVQEQGNAVRSLKEGGRGNADPDVAAAVVVLKERKSELQALHDANAEVEAADEEVAEHAKARRAALVEGPIWSLKRRATFFAFPDRASAKAYASEVAEQTGVSAAVARAKQL